MKLFSRYLLPQMDLGDEKLSTSTLNEKLKKQDYKLKTTQNQLLLTGRSLSYDEKTTLKSGLGPRHVAQPSAHLRSALSKNTLVSCMGSSLKLDCSVIGLRPQVGQIWYLSIPPQFPGESPRTCSSSPKIANCLGLTSLDAVKNCTLIRWNVTYWV